MPGFWGQVWCGVRPAKLLDEKSMGQLAAFCGAAILRTLSEDRLELNWQTWTAYAAVVYGRATGRCAWASCSVQQAVRGLGMRHAGFELNTQPRQTCVCGM